MLHENFQLHFNEPVVIIALLVSIMLIGPVLFERLRLPSIAGLLICGALIGPGGLNLLSQDLEFSLLGTMGLLYLMFLAGLEIDLLDFMENKAKSIIIGLATFIIPFILGFLIFRYLLNYGFIASWLISAMLSSHTLISFPLLNRLGIVQKPIVTLIVGATIIADVMALVSMEIITNNSEDVIQVHRFLILFLQFLFFSAFTFFLIPRVSKLFLRWYEGDLGVQYIYVLFVLFASALIAYILNIEPILGAFFSGLMLNRMIINTSPLYKRIEFIGINLFIPFFLISIGALTNFRIYVSDPYQVIGLFTLLGIAIGGKYLASLIAKVFLSLTREETNLLFGLSISRAASAIAIILVGFNMGVISDVLLNNTVVLILLSCIASSYLTQRAGKKLLLEEKTAPDSIKQKAPQRILVPLANPTNMRNLLEFACLIKDEDPAVPIFPLSIATDRERFNSKLEEKHREIETVINTIHSDVHFEITSRLDNNVTGGIGRAAEELDCKLIIIGWNRSHIPIQILLGGILKNLLQKTERMIMVLKTPSNPGEIRRIHLVIPGNAEYEKGFSLWVATLSILVRRLQIKVNVYCKIENTTKAFNDLIRKLKISGYFILPELPGKSDPIEGLPDSRKDMLIFIHTRKEAISFNKMHEQNMNKALDRLQNNIIIIYPEQA